jgi:hypothetical protein
MLLMAQRHAGIWWSIGAGVWVWHQGKLKHWTYQAVLGLFVFGLLGYGWWIQYRISGSYQHRPGWDFVEAIGQSSFILSAHLGSWWLPLAWPEWLRASLVLVWLTSLIAWAWQTAPRSYQLLFITHAIYVLGLVLIKPYALYFSDLERFAAVLVPGLYLCTLGLLATACGHHTKTLRRGYTAISILLLSVIMLYSVVRTTKNVVFWHRLRCQSVAVLRTAPIFASNASPATGLLRPIAYNIKPRYKPQKSISLKQIIDCRPVT